MLKMSYDTNHVGYDKTSNDHIENNSIEYNVIMESSNTNVSKFEVHAFKCFVMTINKKLLPLKIFCFFMYGTSFILPFCNVLYKQRGISAAEISTMFVFAPVVQILAVVVLGITLEKFKKPKLLFSLDLSILISLLVTIIFLPPASPVTCIPDTPSFLCGTHNETVLLLPCGATNNTLKSGNCNEHFKADHNSHVGLNGVSYNISFDSPFDIIDYVSDINDSYYYIVNNSLSWKGENLTDLCDLFHNADSCISEKAKRGYMVVWYGIVYVLFVTSQTVALRLTDVIAVVMSKQHDGDYGKQHFFGTLGHLSVSAIAGYVVDLLTPEGDSSNYPAALYMAMASLVFLIPFVTLLDITLRQGEERRHDSFFQLLKSIDVVIFIIILVIQGGSFNFSYSYSIWLLESFKAPALLLGLYESLGCGYGLPFLFTASYFLKRVGVYNLFVAAHFAVAVHFILMSYMENPWYSLIYESTNILSFYLPWVAIMEYCHDIAPEGSESTVIVIAGSLYFNVGKSFMALSGGFVLSEYGERTGFRFMASVSLTVGLLAATYYGLRRFRLQRKYQTRVKGCLTCVS